MTSLSAISRLVRPSAIKPAISASRGVSASDLTRRLEVCEVEDKQSRCTVRARSSAGRGAHLHFIELWDGDLDVLHRHLLLALLQQKLGEPEAVLPATLRAYRTQQRRASSYADKLLNAIHPLTRRIHPRLLKLGASESGRMSARQPNVQGLPRDARHRGFVRPESAEKVIVMADYSRSVLDVRAAGDLAD
jgi:hypothetical protein